MIEKPNLPMWAELTADELRLLGMVPGKFKLGTKPKSLEHRFISWEGEGAAARAAQIASAPAAAMSQKPKEGAPAPNPEPGERLTFKRGRWVPLQ